MKKEYLDVVNCRNQVMGQAERGDFYRQGYWHRVSHVIILNEKGEIFLAKRHPNLKIHAGLWGCVGETVKSGESFLRAAQRGTREEMGAKLEISAFEKIKETKFKWLDKGLKNNEIVQLFIARFSGQARISREHTNFGWFYIKGLSKKKNLTPTTIRALKYYNNYRIRQKNFFNKFWKSKEALRVLWENKLKYKAKQKGIKPLVGLLNQKNNPLKYRVVFDKIVGRAAALLLVYAEVGEVHAVIGSRTAAKVFKKYNVYHQFKKTVSQILNQARGDTCPFEKSAKDRPPSQFYKMVKNKF